MSARGGSAEPSICDEAVDGVDGEVSLPVLQLEVSVESASLPLGILRACVSSASPAALGVCVCAPASRVWERARGRSLRLPVGLLTATVSPRLSLLLSGFTCREPAEQH